jgi:crotonobetainyl-CoA:carnitine CoA-transferase CaiB-like acyl-CoA transferase
VGPRHRDRALDRVNTAHEPRLALDQTWAAIGGPPGALDDIDISGDGRRDPILPSSFAIAAAAIAAGGAAARAATLVHERRGGPRQRLRISVDRAVDAFRANHLLRVDGRAPGDVWSPISGFYRTGDDRFVQLHTNFAHHLVRTLRVLDAAATRAGVERSIRTRRAIELEDALAAAGACATVVRTHEEWLAHEQGAAVRAEPLLDITPLDIATRARLPPASDRPLAGIRVLDLTRVIAGPTATRTLAAHGADVLRVSARHLPEIEALLPDTSIGKRSTFCDLREPAGADAFRDLLRGADIVVQSYRPGALDALGFGVDAAAAISPGIVYVSLSAYSHAGPWRLRRGYDTLVQSASGMAEAEGEAFGSERPRHLPASVLDYATGYLAAAAAMLALAERGDDGRARHVRCSLAQTREWLELLGRADGAHVPAPDDDQRVKTLPSIASPLGIVTYAPPAGELSETPVHFDRGPAVPGSDAPEWLAGR